MYMASIMDPDQTGLIVGWCVSICWFCHTASCSSKVTFPHELAPIMICWCQSDLNAGKLIYLF